MPTAPSYGMVASNSVLVDTNLFILFIVGIVDRGLVEKFSRTREYTVEDFDFVYGFLSHFDSLVTTPQVLAELTNLLPVGREDRYSRLTVEAMVRVLQQTREEHVPKDLLLQNSALGRIGFTDVSILEAARTNGHVVITDDFECYRVLEAAGCSVLNLNHIRTQEWFS